MVDAITDGITASPDQLQGLPAGAVLAVERDQQAPMADAYREFLSLIGGGAGRFMQGEAVYHPHVLGLGTAALELLEENESPFLFEPTDRVFFMHQGYQFEFMRGTGPDPEVWSYSEGDHANGPVRSYASFTEWLRATAEAEIPAWKHHVETVREEINADGSITLHW
ncbi:SMI1/KNR4 family protein [Streptomyces sp. NBC_01361]|uniref:SMI1/KNR4 family protein n=1 Tax=Streptomyces sp. NBC_01361 TaxID=2903838 RepID=UPI002E32DECA|nr:SMI1/KNR4 family protein [Streptomyces sp. NBC_01361]